MKPFHPADPWMRNRVIMGHCVSSQHVRFNRTRQELMASGCTEEMALRLARAAIATSAAIDKMMEHVV